MARVSAIEVVPRANLKSVKYLCIPMFSFSPVLFSQLKLMKYKHQLKSTMTRKRKIEINEYNDIIVIQ